MRVCRTHRPCVKQSGSAVVGNVRGIGNDLSFGYLSRSRNIDRKWTGRFRRRWRTGSVVQRDTFNSTGGEINLARPTFAPRAPDHEWVRATHQIDPPVISDRFTLSLSLRSNKANNKPR